MNRIEVFNPATGATSGSVEIATEADIRDSVRRARIAQATWKQTRFSERAAIFRRFHDLVIDRCERILDSIQSESGKTRRDALTEVVTIAGTARYYLSHAEETMASRRREPAVPLVTDAEVGYKPHGVVGLITPWNYPFLVSVGDAIPALLAGNAVIVKPSDWTPLSAVLGRELLIEAGLPSDLFQLIHGPGATGAELIHHVDYVGFTGGTETGRKVAVAAAQRLIPFSLELGGKNPMIVLAGAPLDESVSGLISGAFTNAGQTCISVERIYVQDSIYEEFRSRLIQRTRQLKIGFSKSWEMDIGCLIRESHADKVLGHIERATASGASVLAGGRRRPDLGPTFVEPTVLENVPQSTPVFCDETFGPVVSLYRVRDGEDAIARANASQYGLNASVWSGDSAESLAVARKLETGSVGINSTLLIYNSFDVPMGGVKLSGIGRRHGEQGILRYLQAQSIVSSIAAGGGYDSLTLTLDRPKRVARLLKALKLWRRIPWL